MNSLTISTRLDIIISEEDATQFGHGPDKAHAALQPYINVARRFTNRRVNIKLPDLTTVYIHNAHL